MVSPKSTVLYFLAPVVLAAMLTRPAFFDDYLNRFSAETGNFTMERVSEKIAEVYGSPVPQFLLTYGLIALVLYLAVQLYKALTTPLLVHGDEAGVSYLIHGPEGGESKEERVKAFKKHRVVGKVPPVYPNGWMAVMMSSELKKMETKFVHIAGQNLSVFRGESGQVFIVDAYCAHLGANLAVGGTVKGDCIECPFHGWRFRGTDGKCVKIAYAEKVPEFAKVSSFHCCEKNQLIYFWFHAEGQEPTWQVPNMEEITSGKMWFAGSTVSYIDVHVQDCVENGADIPHLKYLHGPRTMTGTCDFESTWNPSTTEKHISHMSLTNVEKIFGTISMPKFKFEFDQIGPCLTQSYLNAAIVGKMIFIFAVTPIGPMRQKYLTTAFSQANPISFYAAKKMLLGQYYGFEADVTVFANKTYMPKPLYVKEDAQIAKHRKWYAQFYSENSPKYSPNECTVDW